MVSCCWFRFRLNVLWFRKDLALRSAIGSQSFIEKSYVLSCNAYSQTVVPPDNGSFDRRSVLFAATSRSVEAEYLACWSLAEHVRHPQLLLLCRPQKSRDVAGSRNRQLPAYTRLLPPRPLSPFGIDRPCRGAIFSRNVFLRSSTRPCASHP